MEKASIARRASVGFVWNQIAQILYFGLQFLVSIVIARGLGAAEYGIYATLLSFVSLATLLSSLGFEQILNTYIPRIISYQAGKAKVTYLVRKLLCFRLFSVIIVSIGVLVFSKPIADLMHSSDLDKYLKFAVFYLIFFSLSAFLRMILVGQLKMREASLVQVGSSLATLGLSYALLELGFGIEGLIVTLILVSFLSGLGYLFFSRKQIFSDSEPFNLSEIYKFGLTLWLINFVNYMLGKQSDLMLMGFFLVSSSQIGFYNLSFGIIEKLNVLLISGLAGVGLAAFSEIKANQGLDALAKAWRAVMSVVMVLSLPIVVFVIGYAKSIVLTLYSQEYFPSVALLQVFACFHLLIRLTGGGANSTVMYVMNKEKADFYLRLGAGAFNLALAFLLIPRYQAWGAIIATGVSKLAVAVLEAIFAHRYVPLQYPVGFVIKIVVVSFLSLGISYIISGDTLLSLISSGILYAIALVSMLYVLKPLDEETKTLLSRVDKRVYAVLKAF